MHNVAVESRHYQANTVGIKVAERNSNLVATSSSDLVAPAWTWSLDYWTLGLKALLLLNASHVCPTRVQNLHLIKSFSIELRQESVTLQHLKIKVVLQKSTDRLKPLTAEVENFIWRLVPISCRGYRITTPGGTMANSSYARRCIQPHLLIPQFFSYAKNRHVNNILPSQHQESTQGPFPPPQSVLDPPPPQYWRPEFVCGKG